MKASKLLIGTTSAALLILLPSAAKTQPSPVALPILKRDEALQVKVDFSNSNPTVSQVLRLVSRKTGLVVTTADTELQNALILVKCHDTSAYRLMDAVSALYLCRWEKTKQNNYYLLGSQRELDIAYGPHSDAHQRRLALGKAFLRSADTLPPAQKEKLWSSGVSMSSLPPTMQTQVGGLLNSLGEDIRQRDAQSQLSFNNYLEGRIGVRKKPSKGFSIYDFHFSTPNANGSFSITDYAEHRDTARSDSALSAFNSRVAGKGKDVQEGVILATEKSTIDNAEAKRLPELQRRVTVQGRNMTFPQVLLYLHEQYGIAFVCDPRTALPQRAQVSLVNLPLGGALDALTDLYKNTEWEWRETGFVIVRGPTNIARGTGKEAAGSSRPRP